MVCDGSEDDIPPKDKGSRIKKLGGIGLVMVTDVYGSEAPIYADIPVTVIYPRYRKSIYNYITSTR